MCGRADRREGASDSSFLFSNCAGTRAAIKQGSRRIHLIKTLYEEMEGEEDELKGSGGSEKKHTYYDDHYVAVCVCVCASREKRAAASVCGRLTRTDIGRRYIGD